MPTAIEQTGRAEVTGTLGASGGPLCTSDMVATSNWVELPEDLDVHSLIRVDIDDETIVVEPAPGSSG